MRKGLIMFAAAMLLSLASVAQNAETVNVSKERDGYFVHTFGDTRVEGNVRKGLKEGTWYEYNNTKNLLRRVIQFQNGTMDGLYMEIDENGYISKKTEYVKGNPEGTSYTWTNGGRLTQKSSYRNGKLHGEQILCYDNGNNQEVSNYTEGLRDGVTTWFNREGNKSMMITYRKGLFDGKQETYYATGGLKSSKMFKNNVLEGQSVEYYEGGDMKSEATYKNGSLVGKVKQYEDKHPFSAAKEAVKKEGKDLKLDTKKIAGSKTKVENTKKNNNAPVKAKKE